MAIEKKNTVSPATGYRILKEGEFDIDKLYDVIVNWFEKRKYTFNETENTEKVKPQGNDLNLKLDGDRKVDDYAQFWIKVYILVIEMRKRGEGKYAGKMKINVDAYIDLDYMENWQDTPFKRFLFHIYNNYIIKKKIKDGYEDDLEAEANELLTAIKKAINLHD